MTGVDTSLAQLSNDLLYSAMAVYALAMVGYAALLAAGRGRRVGAERAVGAPDAQAAPERVLVAAAGGPTATASPPPSIPPVPPRGGGPARSRAERLARTAVALTILAFALHLASVVARGLSVRRAPWGNMFEFNVAGALAVVGVYLVLLLWRRGAGAAVLSEPELDELPAGGDGPGPVVDDARRERFDLRLLGLFVVGPALLVLGLAVTVFYTEAAQLLPALKSVWLVIHVAAAIVASGVFTLGFSLSVLYLVQDRRERRAAPAGRPASVLDRLPTAAMLDRAAYRVHAFGFPLWTFAVIAGAIWAQSAWGRYWGWDPKETWAFITWVVYAGYLHARLTVGWRGRRAAYLGCLGFATLLANYVLVNLFAGGSLHGYSGL